MSLLASLQRRAALLAVAGGFGIFAAALGGMATVDDELRAVAPLQTSEVVRVSAETPASADCERDTQTAADLAKEL
jgi:hypothetical protein